MLSSSQSQKRRLPAHIPTPHELARLFKRPRVEPSTQNYAHASLLHSIPQGAVPILEAPYTVADFFSDVAVPGDQVASQHLRSARAFPPPMPPPVSLVDGINSELPGVMVPFIYPALPALQFDPWTVYPDGTFPDKPKVKKEHKRKRRHVDVEETDGKQHTDLPSSVAHPAMAPLPFPPANYMPYPLIADRAPLTPHDVFSSFLDASRNLPRVDMVLASAAGSIFDLHSQAVAEELNTSKLDELLRLGRLDRSDARTQFSDDDDSFNEYLAYASNVDTTTVTDPYAEPKKNIVVVNLDRRIKALLVQPQTSKNGEIEKKTHHVLENDDVDIDSNVGLEESENASVASSASSIPSFEFENKKDLILQNGVQKAKRRQALARMAADLENHADEHRAQIYARKKQQLRARLRALRECKVSFDNDPASISDAELRDYVEQRQVQRDDELVQLRVAYNYEKLKNVLNFYQTSHRSYKTMNGTMVNKLQKLRHFFEHQRQVLDSAARTADADAKNMRSRESEKLYGGFVEQEYGNEIKEEFRSVLASEDGTPLDQNKSFDASLFHKVYKGHEHPATVEDYMPLVTKDEFKLITGDAPAKTVNKDAGNKNKSARHQIFQSLLYDRVTSGSDSEAPVVKRRPGRRAAPKPTYGEEAKASNDAALVAKIMKQFVGPGSANTDELAQDLQSIGIDSKWPVK